MTSDMVPKREAATGVETALTREDLVMFGESVAYEYNARALRARAEDLHKRAVAKRDSIFCGVRERVEAAGREPACCVVVDLVQGLALAMPHENEPDDSGGKTVGGIPEAVLAQMPSELRSLLEEIESMGVKVEGKVEAAGGPGKKKGR